MRKAQRHPLYCFWHPFNSHSEWFGLHCTLYCDVPTKKYTAEVELKHPRNKSNKKHLFVFRVKYSHKFGKRLLSNTCAQTTRVHRAPCWLSCSKCTVSDLEQTSNCLCQACCGVTVGCEAGSHALGQQALDLPFTS